MPDNLTSSQEDYLEAIYNIVLEKNAARAKDIAERLQVSGASVTAALRALSDRELINYTPYDVITLTETGHAVAKDVVRRHDVLRDFFAQVLHIEDEEAEAAACRMEHAMPANMLDRFVQFLAFVEAHPEFRSAWKEHRENEDGA